MKDVEEALERHLQEWHESLVRPATPRGTIPTLSEDKARELGFILDETTVVPPDQATAAAPSRRRQGRPWTLDMNDSFHAFVFVYREMNVFKKRNDLKRCPETVRDRFIEIALETGWYPNAKESRIRELLRENKKYI